MKAQTWDKHWHTSFSTNLESIYNMYLSIFTDMLNTILFFYILKLSTRDALSGNNVTKFGYKNTIILE